MHLPCSSTLCESRGLLGWHYDWFWLLKWTSGHCISVWMPRSCWIFVSLAMCIDALSVRSEKPGQQSGIPRDSSSVVLPEMDMRTVWGCDEDELTSIAVSISTQAVCSQICCMDMCRHLFLFYTIWVSAFCMLDFLYCKKTRSILHNLGFTIFQLVEKCSIFDSMNSFKLPNFSLVFLSIVEFERWPGEAVHQAWADREGVLWRSLQRHWQSHATGSCYQDHRPGGGWRWSGGHPTGDYSSQPVWQPLHHQILWLLSEGESRALLAWSSLMCVRQLVVTSCIM